LSTLASNYDAKEIGAQAARIIGTSKATIERPCGTLVFRSDGLFFAKKRPVIAFHLFLQKLEIKRLDKPNLYME
jgi:hypothetical protein